MDLSYIRKTSAGVFWKKCGAGNQENTESRGDVMSKKERKEVIEEMAEKFAGLEEKDKFADCRGTCRTRD